MRGPPTLWILPAMADEAGKLTPGQDEPKGDKDAPTEATATAPAPEARTEAKAATAPAPEAPKTKKPQSAAPPSEEEIDSPDWKTLGFLFAIFAVTVSSWGAARFACNMHPPESKPPPKLTTDKLAANPKDAAIEFIQRARSNDFDGALELAVRDAKSDLESSRAECMKSAADCARKREAMAGLLTTAIVQREDPSTADAVAPTYFKGEKKNFRVKLVRDAAMWKVISYSAE